MLPLESHLTIMGSIIIGFCFGLANRYLASIILSVILAMIVESYAVSTNFWYTFGNHLYKHLLIAVAVSSAVFVLLRLIAMLFYTPRVTMSPMEVTSADSHKTAVIAHALGLLNFFPFVGSIALAIFWGFHRKAVPLSVEQIKEAFQFQALYMVIFIVLLISLGLSFPNIGLALTTNAIMLVWFILTLSAVVLSSRKGTFHYPINFRFLGH